jgi:crotonobetainyl-CoA:carnitine CoA-transferase CaiB-like acyl-CoA transferase
MSVTGLPGQGPVRTGAAIADITGGLLAALGIMTALLEREVSGKGQWVQSSLLQAGLVLMDFQAARYLMKGEVPQQMGNDHPTSMPTSAYRTADGYLNVGASGQAMWKRLCEAVERPDLVEKPEFAHEGDRSKNRVELNAALNAEFNRRTSAEWIDILNRAGVPCGPINAIDQVFADPQVQHLRCAAPVQHPALGEIRLVNQMVGLSRTPAAMARPTPELGEHTDEILRDLGYDDARIADLRERKVI